MKILRNQQFRIGCCKQTIMTKAEFEAWTREAEQKRDAVLEPYARAESEEERQRIAAELEEKLNRL